jgi:hypothetical protein
MSPRGTSSKRRRSTKARRPRKRPAPTGAIPEQGGAAVELVEERLRHPETSPALSGGDVDADWRRAEASGEETVGGSVATPDQDVVDELGHALGVEQESDAEVHTSDEILRARDRHYWHLERRAADEDEGKG